jgi:lipopolysaccharide export system ATP-binding protein
MKHRLPKAKSSTSRIVSQSGMEQAELLIGEPQPESPSDTGRPRRSPPPLPVTFRPTTPVNETSTADPDDSGLLNASAPAVVQPKDPAAEGDAYGFIEDAPPAEAKPDDVAAPAKIKSHRAMPPPLPIKSSRATPPPLPARRPPPLPTPGVVEENSAAPEPAPEFVEKAPALTETAPIVVPEPPVVFESEPVSATPPPLLRPKPLVISEEPRDHTPLLIRTQGLVKQYGGRRVVNGVDIHVSAGEVVGLLGKNGAGKTTTFYMIVGLVPPTLGHVFMGEEDVTHMPMYRRARRGIGYLPQEESIFRKLTVEENLLAILETLPMTEDEREIRCDELLKDFGLEHVRENVAITLSGGEKRRVTIARALVASPTLLLLDEPFSGVDPMAVHDIQEIILHLKERGLGVLITDHNVRETLSVVDRAYIIDEGRVLSEGSREFLLNDPIAREIYLGHRFSM